VPLVAVDERSLVLRVVRHIQLVAPVRDDAPGRIELPDQKTAHAERVVDAPIETCGLQPCHRARRKPRRVDAGLPPGAGKNRDDRRSGGPSEDALHAKGERRKRGKCEQGKRDEEQALIPAEPDCEDRQQNKDEEPRKIVTTPARDEQQHDRDRDRVEQRKLHRSARRPLLVVKMADLTDEAKRVQNALE